MNAKHRRTKLRQPILVLWGDGGEETVATIFVAELRAAGRLVKLVGLGGKRLVGVHGLALIPDMTLGQALAHASKAAYVIIPFTGAGLQRFATDPRLQQLCELARSNGAQFIHSNDAAARAALRTIIDTDPSCDLLTYPQGEALFEFVHGLVRMGLYTR